MNSQDEKNIKAFGRNVKAIRKKQKPKMSQAQLAYECGLPTNTIARIERGEINTGITNAYRIIETLNVNAGELFKPNK